MFGSNIESQSLPHQHIQTSDNMNPSVAPYLTFEKYPASYGYGGGGLKGAFENRMAQQMNHSSTISIIPSTSNNIHGLNKFDDHYNDNDWDTQEKYTAGYHSIHRLKTFNNGQNSNYLLQAFEARMGGIPRKTLERNKQNKEPLEKQANLIVSKMEQDEALMEDSPDAEQLRKATLRDMPQSLTTKRCVKEKLSKSVKRKSKRKTISCFKTFKYRISMSMSKLQSNIKDLAYSFELWYSPLKKIEGNFGTGVASYFKLLRWFFLLNLLTAIIAVGFIVVPAVLVSEPAGLQEVNSTVLANIITGEGFLTDSLLFYGYYRNTSISFGIFSYNISYAYFFTMAFIYLVSFAIISISMVKSYRRSFIETEGGLKNIFTNKIFCGWDYSIATRDAADLKSKAIYNELKELLNDISWRNKELSFAQKIRKIFRQFCINIFIIFLIIGTSFMEYLFLTKLPLDRTVIIIISPIFINAVFMFLPMIFSFLIRFENYKNPKVTVLLTLVRTFILSGVTIGVLIYHWLGNNSQCWETDLGQEIYRMIIFDFLISIVCAALIDCILYFVFKFTTSFNLEFNIAWNTMELIYGQTLFWTGLMFSPLLSVIVVIKLFVTWYIRQCVALYLCKPSTKTWRAAQASTWFLVLAFVSFLGVGGVLMYISYVPISKSCGPFRQHTYLFDVLTDELLNLKSNSNVWKYVLYVTKPGVIGFAILALCSMVYVLSAKANAQKQIVAQYRNMLMWSAKDKEYYYSLIRKVSRGEWKFNLNDREENPDLYQPENYLNNQDTISTESTSSPAIAMIPLMFNSDQRHFSHKKST